jgi:outer membrane protein assembly factor BamB
MLEKKHPSIGEIHMPTGLLLSAVVLAGVFFIYANFIPKKPRLERAIVSIDRDTGAIKWISRGLLGARGELSPENSPATPTPVTDGKRVYGYFGTPGVLCTDTRGKWLWTYRKLPFESREGVASSPVLVDGKLVILSESDKGCYLAALDADTGKLLWKTDRKKKTHSYAGNCRTPSLINIQGNKTIVTWGLEDISGYDPFTGRETWSLAIGDFGTGGNPVACAVYDGSYVYLVGPARTMCLDINKMQADKPTIIWDIPTVDGAQCASPIIQNGLLFAVSDNGNVYCIDAATGANVWSHNLGTQHYSSLVTIGEKVYLTNTRGYTTIIACDHRYRKLGEADLRESIFASFAPVDGDLFIRTKTQLYRVH